MTEIIKTEKSILITYELSKILPNEEDKDLIKRCIEEIKDNLEIRPEIKIYGRKLNQNRDIGFYSDESKGYQYSGTIAKSKPLTENLKYLLEGINKYFESEYNGILINCYNDGTQSIGKHSDDEKFLDKTGVIAISYGATRKFRIRDKQTGKIVKDLYTHSNQVIHMSGDFQKEFTHEIPVEKKVLSTRYSLTFRKHLI